MKFEVFNVLELKHDLAGNRESFRDQVLSDAYQNLKTLLFIILYSTLLSSLLLLVN